MKKTSTKTKPKPIPRGTKKKVTKKKVTKKKVVKKAVGRPAFKLEAKELKQLESLAQCGCTNDEISAVLQHPFSTLYHNYGEVIKRGRNSRNASLRHKQYQVAMTGDRTLLIWLGKQYLGQQDSSKMDIPALEKLTEEYAKLTTDEIISRINRLVESESQAAFKGNDVGTGSKATH